MRMGLFTSFQLKSKDAGTRRKAALSLGVAGKSSNLTSLTPLLEDPEWTVREAAVQSLGVIGDAGAAPSIIQALRLADKVQDQAGANTLRMAAVTAMGRLGPTAVPTLVEALGDRHSKLREGVIEALGAIGGADAAAALGRTLTDDRSSVRQGAALALRRIGGAEAVPSLRAALAHKDPTTRRSAAEALGSIKDVSAVDALSAAIGERDRNVREAVLRGLAAIGAPAAVDALIRALESDDREAQSAASGALRSFEWTPQGDHQKSVHAMLHGQFDQLGAEAGGGREVLLAALADRDPGTRRGALTALARLRDPQTAASIAVLLKDTDSGVRDAAVDTLAAIGPAAADAVTEAFRERAATAKAAADRVVAAIGEGPFVEALLERCSVGQLATHAGADILIVLTRDVLDDVRRASDALDLVLDRLASKVPPAVLQKVAALADTMLIEPGHAPGDSDAIDHGPLREAAAAALAKRG
jgi:HEAT repeat protein